MRKIGIGCGALLGIAIILAIIGSLLGSPDDSTAPVSSTPTPRPVQAEKAAPPAAKESPSKVESFGTTQMVGKLDITPLGAERHDTTAYNMFNDPNYRVRIRIRNVRGDADSPEGLQAWDVSLLGANSQWYDATSFCADCPDPIDEFSLAPGGTAEGYLYFEVPDGVTIAQLTIDPPISLLGSNEKVRWSV